MQPVKSIEELGNTGIRVVLLRRTGEESVAAAVGYRDAHGNIRGWYRARPPTHWTQLPTYPPRIVLKRNR